MSQIDKNINEIGVKLSKKDADSITTILQKFGKQLPNKTAYVFIDKKGNESKLTFLDVLKLSQNLATHLQSKLAVGDRAILMYENEKDFVIGFWACLFSGIVGIPVPPIDSIRAKFALPRLHSIIQDSSAKAILTSDTMTERFDFLKIKGAPIILTNKINKVMSAFKVTANIKLSEVAYLQYTSGSTSEPKGVMITHNNIVNNVEYMCDAWGLTNDSVSCSWLPYFHDYGLVYGIILPVFKGVKTVIMSPSSFIRNPMRWLDIISKHQVTHTGGPNFGYDLCIRRYELLLKPMNLNLSSWVCAHNGAEPIRIETLNKFSKIFEKYGFSYNSFFPSYGMAETTLMVSTKKSSKPRIISVNQNKYEQGQITQTNNRNAIDLIGSGMAAGNTSILIVSPENKMSLGKNTIGEIWVQDESVAPGYWNNPEATKETFNAYTSDTGEGPFLRTGDLGFLDESGELYITSRLKDLIIIRGRNIYPHDIELDVEKAHEAIKQHGVVAFSVDVQAEEKMVVVAEINKKLTKDVDLKELSRTISEKLAEQFEVDCYDLVFTRSGSIPKTSSGKIQHRLSKQMYQNQQFRVLFSKQSTKEKQVQDSTPLEGPWAIEISQIWGNILDRDPSTLTIGSNFLSLGGDSLNALELSEHLSIVLGEELGTNFVFKYPTVQEQSSFCLSKKSSPRRNQNTGRNIVLTKSDHSSPFPLTDIQRSYWLGRTNAFEQGNIGCHFYLEIDTETINLKKLEDAWNTLISRHGMLRANVTADGQQQIIEDVPDYSIGYEDISTLGTNTQQQTLSETRKKLSHHVYNVYTWPLFNIQVTKTATQYRIHFSIDLICVDAKSIMLLFNEWQQLYLDNSALSPLHLTFQDVSHYLSQKTELKNYENDKAYWKSKASNIYPAPDLPTLRQVKSVGTPHFTRYEHTFSLEESVALERVAKSSKITKSCIILTLFGYILKKWSKSSKFSVNVTNFLRPNVHPQINDVVGDFTSNTLFSMDYSSSESFQKTALKNQENLWEDLSHRHFSGIEMLRHLSKETDVSLMPIVFTSLLGIDGATEAFSRFGNIAYAVSQTPQVWLDHQVYDIDGNLTITWDVLDNFFPPNLIEDMFDSYKQLCQDFFEKRDLIKWKPEALLPANQQGIRNKTNETEAPISNECLHTLFLKSAEAYPNKEAIVTTRKRLTYQELKTMSSQVASELEKRHVQPNELVAIVQHKGWEQIVSSLGILQSGAAYLPIDPDLPEERVLFLLENTGSRIVLTQSKVHPEFNWPDSVECISIDTFAFNNSYVPMPVKQKTTDLAYVIFTSGSTGKPKGVIIDHKGAVNTILDINQRFGITSEDKVLGISCLNFDLSVYDIFGMLAVGGTLVLPNGCQLKDPEHVAEIIRDEKVTVWNSVPALMDMQITFVEDKPELQPTSLRLAMFSGDWIPVTLPEKLWNMNPDIKLYSLGGATEASIWSIFYPINEVKKDWASIPYGKPLKNQRFYVLNADLEPCPDWVPGELYIGGIGLALGYWKDKEKTESHFITHPVSGEKLYRTGDWGRFYPDGNIEFLGREDGQVKVRGHRIECGEIETTLLQHKEVEAALVMPIKDSHSSNSSLAAYIVKKASNLLKDAVIISSENIILDAKKRTEFRLAEHNIRKDGNNASIALPTVNNELEPLLNRRSVRSFKAEIIPLPFFSQYLSCLKQYTLHNVPKHAYPSAGSLYPVQTYVYVKKNRISGLKEGLYYYHPKHHGLNLISSEPIDPNIHVSYNQPFFESSAFSIFLLGNLDAIQPLYGNVSRDFCLLEAGYMGQLLMTEAEKAGLGVCPIGALDFEQIQPLFKSESNSFLCHTFVCGVPDNSSENDSKQDLSETLSQYLQKKLPDYMVPSIFIECDQFPTTSNGKIDRKALPDPSSYFSRRLSTYEPPSSEIEKKLCKVWATTLKLERVGITDHFFEYGGDSMSLISLSIKMSKILNQNVNASDIVCKPTIKEFLDQKNINLVNLNEEAILEDDIHPIPNSPHLPEKNVLLTGATGYLGAFLLKDLLNMANIQSITCLVRAENDQEAFERVQQNLETYKLLEQCDISRLQVIASDISKANFGLSEPTYSKLSCSIDTIYHSAAYVNFVSDYQGLKPHNVEGVKHIIQFCCSNQNKTLKYVSTMAVYDSYDMEGKNVDELTTPPDGNQLFGGYAQSKWVGERLINQIANRGLQTIIYRLPVLFGDTKNGFVSENDFFVNLIRACVEVRKYPDIDISPSVVPVDFSSAIITSISADNYPSDLKQINMTVLEKFNIQQVIEWIAPSIRTKIKKVSFAEWTKSLNDTDAHSLDSVMPFVQDKLKDDKTILEHYEASCRPSYNSDKTIKFLKDLGISFPNAKDTRWLRKTLHEILKKSNNSKNMQLNFSTPSNALKLESSAIVYLPPSLLASGLSKAEIKQKIKHPCLFNCLETPSGNIGLILLPHFEEDFFIEKKQTLNSIVKGIGLAEKYGSKAVSLTGLLASATNYGKDIIPFIKGLSVKLTTGHATTVATVNLMVEKILNESKRELSLETVGFLGLGSIGLGTLKLMLNLFVQPKKLLLCDLYQKHEKLVQIKKDIIAKGYKGEIEIILSSGKLPDLFYTSTLIVAATSAPDIIDVDKLKPGTLIVDDSWPHAFNTEKALARFDKASDILFTEGGFLQAPFLIREKRYFIDPFDELSPYFSGALLNRQINELTGCILSGLLISIDSSVGNTIGHVNFSTARQHYEFLREKGYFAAEIRCDGDNLSVESFNKCQTHLSP